MSSCLMLHCRLGRSREDCSSLLLSHATPRRVNGKAFGPHSSARATMILYSNNNDSNNDTANNNVIIIMIIIIIIIHR